MPMTPYGKSNSVGGFNSGDVDWSAFYNNMGAGENNTLGGTPYTNTAWGASSAQPIYVPGTANGSTLVGKNQTQFATDNPLQAQMLAYAGQYPTNPAVAATAAQASTPYNNPGWGAVFQQYLSRAKVGANPGMGGLYGTPMAPGIPAQLPPADGSSPLPNWRGGVPTAGGYSLARPIYGRVGTLHNGASSGPAAFSSGGYLFDRNGAQIGRDSRYRAEAGSRGTAAGSDSNSKFETTAVQRANYDRQGISY